MKKARAATAATWPRLLRPFIDEALDRFLPSADAQPEPLHRAMRYAVFSGGKRLRPQFLLTVAQVCGATAPELELSLRAACAVELIHAASLVHDDLPCFDNAALRRGRPTVHVLFGEATALLTGDALLARSFELLAAGPRTLAARSLRLVQLLATATGSSSGLVGGQGLEQLALAGQHGLESAASYHTLKTGALFAMAAEAAAVATGSSQAAAWAAVGWLFGSGYQLVHENAALPAESRGAATTAEAISAGARLRVQIAALASTLREHITALATEPEPLLGFLRELCEPLLAPDGGRAEKPPPDPPLHPDAEGV